MFQLSIKQWILFSCLFLFSSLLLSALPQSLNLTAEEQDWLDSHPVIQVGVDQNWPPFDYVDKVRNHRGIASSYLEAISHMLGIQFNIVPGSWENILTGDIAHQLDMLACAVITEERQQYLDFTAPYIEIDTVFVSRTGAQEINSLADLEGKTVALPKGTYIHELLKNNTQNINFKFVKSNQEALYALSLGKADAYIGNLAVITHFIEQNLLTNLRVDNRLFQEKSQLAFAVHKDLPLLHSVLQKGLLSLSTEKHKQIIRTWVHFGRYHEEHPRLSFSDEQKSWLQKHQHQVFQIGVNPSWAPIEYMDFEKSEYQGIASEYEAYLEKVLSVKGHYNLDSSWEQVLKKIKAGEIDILPALSKTPRREKYFNFTRPYLRFLYVIFARDDEESVTSMESLIDKKIVVERNYASHEILKSNYPEIELMLVDNTKQALTMLSLGQVDAYMGNLSTASHVVLQTGISNLKVAAPTPFSNELAFAVRKDWPELVGIIQQVLDSISPRQAYEFKKKWFAVPYEPEIDYVLIWTIVSVSVLVFILFSLWVWQVRKQKEALRISEERFQLAMNAAKEGIWDWNIKTKDIYLSPGYYEMLGYLKNEQQGEQANVKNLVHPDDKSTVENLENLFASNAKQHEYDFRLQHKLGHYIDVHFVGSVVSTDDNGMPIRAVGTLENITDRKKIQTALEQQKFALDASSIVTMSDMNGNFTYVNDNFCLISGYSREDVIGKNYRLLSSGIHQKSFWIEVFKYAEKGVPWRGEICNKAKDGALFWLDSTILGLFDCHGELEQYISIRSDITERKRVEMELAHAKQAAEEANHFKSDFLSNMSHEIRTPMNAIIGLGYLALKTDSNSQQRDYIEKIQNASQSLLTIINDILDFSKIEAGKLHLESVSFQLDVIFEGLRDLFSFACEEKNIELIFAINSKAPATLVGDPTRLSQVLINLCSNALKFTERGEITISVDVINLAEHKVVLNFSVTDTGCGISEQLQNSLFDSFFQGDTSTTRLHGGTGLGLAICKKLVDLMNGVIHVESKPDQGSCFKFSAEFGIDLQQTKPYQWPPYDLLGLRVLVVESNAVTRAILRDQLVAFSFKVTTVDNVERAYMALEDSEKTFDLILVDWPQREVKGLSLIESLRQNKQQSKIPVLVMVSAHMQEVVAKEVEKKGLDSFMIKPMTASTLYDSIIKALKPCSVKSTANAYLEHKALIGSVLLVEDNLINQQVAQELLKSFGLNVEVAVNGLDAIKKITRQSAKKVAFDLVLMDVQMPEMDGIQATLEIRKNAQFNNLPIVAMTANAMVGDKEKSLNAGMNEHITKPIDPEELYKVLSRRINNTTSNKTISKLENCDESFVSLPESSENLDVTWGVARVGGSRKLFSKLLREFYLDHYQDIQLLTQAFSEKRFQDVKRIIHTIKGVSGNIGARKLYQSSVNLEEALIDGGNYSASLNVFEQNFIRFLGELENFKESDHKENKQISLSTEKLIPEIKRLQQLLNEGDVDALKVLNTLKGHLKSLNTEVSELQQAIENYDFDIAVGLLQEIIDYMDIDLKKNNTVIHHT